MSKYRNIRTRGFASRKEADRALQLGILQKLGEISGLETQVKFELIPKQGKLRAVHYICDFRYRDRAGNVITEDVKGQRTREYILKKKLLLFRHGIEILET